MSDPAVVERTPVEQQAPRKGEGMSEIGFPAMAALQVGFGLLLLAIWQIASGWFIDPFFISSPTAVISRLWSWFRDGSIFVHIWATVYATLLGFAIGAVSGVVGGVWLGLSPFFSRLLSPYIWAFNATCRR